jgi:NAD(P)-dependent dehydrogenase (short-subunit alcohol dehydrogenase family)
VNALKNTTDTPKRKTSWRGFPDPGVTIRPTPVDQLDLAGQRLTVIGGTNGLGRAIARRAHARGAEVTVVGRTFRDTPDARLRYVSADLSSMSTADGLGQELPVETSDILLLTTGIIAAPAREVTADGLERDLAISYLSRLAVLRGAAHRLGTGRPAGVPAPRVFVMGSPGTGALGDPDDLNTERQYEAMVAHNNTIAGNEALVLGAAARFPGPSYYGLGPGLVKTDIRSNYLGEGSFKHRFVEGLVGAFGPSADVYAGRIVPLLVAAELEGRNGLMFGSKGQPVLPTDGFGREHVDRMLNASESLLDRVLQRG